MPVWSININVCPFCPPWQEACQSQLQGALQTSKHMPCTGARCRSTPIALQTRIYRPVISANNTNVPYCANGARRETHQNEQRLAVGHLPGIGKRFSRSKESCSPSLSISVNVKENSKVYCWTTENKVYDIAPGKNVRQQIVSVIIPWKSQLLSSGNATDEITVVTTPSLWMRASEQSFLTKATYCKCEIRGNGCGLLS